MIPFWVALGAVFGALCRYWLALLSARFFGNTFPWGTLFVNGLGCFLMGFFVVFFAWRGGDNSAARACLTVGFLGSFTTFSSFAFDGVFLAKRGDWEVSLFYLSFSVLFGIFALLLGLWIAQLFFRVGGRSIL